MAATPEAIRVVEAPPTRYDRVVSNFIIHALIGEPITLFTGPVNLGNDGEFTIRELAELCSLKSASLGHAKPLSS